MNKEILLKEEERMDDLQRNGYKIIQNPNKFCFGMDAVLLSGFAQVKRGEKALDLGTGTGIIPILLEAKTKGEHFTGLEIQEESADMAARRVGGVCLCYSAPTGQRRHGQKDFVQRPECCRRR